jgi:hypothetical protein
MDEDLDTHRALAVLIQFGDEILEAARAGRDVRAAQGTLRQLGQVFGLRLDALGPEERVRAGWNLHLERFQDPAN